MYPKKKKKMQRKQVIGILVLFGIFLVSFFYREKPLEIQKKCWDIGNFISGIFIPKVDELGFQMIEGMNQELFLENQELKKMLELEPENYQVIHATVTKREIDWFSTLTIDKGKKDGIEENMAVISSQGLIGKVLTVNDYSSSVKLLSSNSNDMKVAVNIFQNEEIIHGILDGFWEPEKLLQIKYIAKEKPLEIGNLVYTSGLGEIYPAGIYLGTIIKLEDDPLGLYQIAFVKPDTSYDTIRYVSIITRRNS